MSRFARAAALVLLIAAPPIKFPTGSMTKGTGSGTVDVGVTAIASHDIHGVAMDLNAAYTRIGGERSSAPWNVGSIAQHHERAARSRAR